MRSLLLAFLVLIASSACSAPHQGMLGLGFHDDEESVEAGDGDEELVKEHGIGHALLFYIPNRIFDVFDVVRARVRLGLGFGVSARATRLASVTVAAYSTVFVGIHGPRAEPSIPWPVGLEVLAGAGVSVVEAEADAGFGPDYGPVEFGLGVQLAVIGVDVGVEPLELLDLLAGIFFINLTGDDY